MWGKPENREMDSRKSQEKQQVAGQQESKERQQKVTGKAAESHREKAVGPGEAKR